MEGGLVRKIEEKLGCKLVNDYKYFGVFTSEEGKIIVIDCVGMNSIDLRRLVKVLFFIIRGDIELSRFSIYLAVPLSGNFYEDLVEKFDIGLFVKTVDRVKLVRRGGFIENFKINSTVKIDIDERLMRRLGKAVSLLEQIERRLANRELLVTVSIKEKGFSVDKQEAKLVNK